MARTRKKRGPVASAAPLRKVPPTVGEIDPAALLRELAAAYAAVGARAMPDDLLGALRYAERNQTKLTAPDAVRKTALTDCWVAKGRLIPAPADQVKLFLRERWATACEACKPEP